MKFFDRGLRCLPLFSLVLGLLHCATSRAQGYAEGVGLSYEVLPLKLSGREAAFRADVYRANVIVPLAVSADSSHGLLLGASLEALRFSGERPGFAVNNVYGFSPIVGYRQRISPRLELTALALPALNSDLRDVRAADITWGGVGRATFRFNPRRAYRLTVGYRQQFYGPQYVLLLGLDWRLGQRWRLFGDLPTTVNVSYAAGPRVNVGFNLNGINTAYRLQEQNRYFQYLQGHYGLFAETYLSPYWALRATAAYAVTRRLEVYAQNDQWPATIDYIGLGQAPTPLSPRIAKGLAFRLALSYRVPAP
ncbi:DUF6268 family outer membrane beta-barrel protein [Hymenobacter armeniacus]|uniref:DUF6268 domain-containing protein n=1 Tax=Hymenobacter armeniacus TaxID=2771358 RepID=A0ABR8JL17_9BACT|nr:DUF6268 family outer membrane beta-barrel protein [Hymenobacter armeniacus]MBD2720690.1 hypothetical protein [Hymenobacter armeniacus]